VGEKLAAVDARIFGHSFLQVLFASFMLREK